MAAAVQGQRAFAQKLNKQHAADVRRQIAVVAQSKDSKEQQSIKKRISTCACLCVPQVPLRDVVDPPDFEEFINAHRDQIDRDPIHHLLDFPIDDIEVGILPRKCRTLLPLVLRDADCDLEPHIRNSIQHYTSDWIVVNRRYQQFSTSCFIRDQLLEKTAVVKSTPSQQYEVDLDSEKCSKCGSDQISEQGSVQNAPLAQDDEKETSRYSITSDTPRGSWASSIFDLRNSVADDLIPSLLERAPAKDVDRQNDTRRHEDRQEAFFALYTPTDDNEAVEKRLLAEAPMEHCGHRIYVKCLALKLELDFEPLFCTMAIYDAKEKKKISENFYFDMNPEPLKRMLSGHITHQDMSTLSRSCIFEITYPSSDLFLVVKLEKVLQQGDISEVAEPYMKDDKNREKVRSNASAACDRLGAYRMPFAWTAVYLMNVVNGVSSLDSRDSCNDKDITASSNLDRKGSATSLDSFWRKSGVGDTGSLGRRSSLERNRSFYGSEKRRSWSPEEFASSLDTFRPVTLTVNSFFKQEGDKLRDEDLYKFLADLKRPSSVHKKLKCIPGMLKLDISPCLDEIKYCLTPELERLHPYPDDKGRPIKEILEFPSREVYVPHYTYRNLLFVYPKDLNFTNRPGSARNIACKIELMYGEEPLHALPIIYGKSSCPEYAAHSYTAVTYHNKSPDFYEECKIKLPLKLTEQHHLKFTFYHISCQKKVELTPIETLLGCTWLPIYQDGRLKTGSYSLPVIQDEPPPNYSVLNPEIQLPGSKWVDNHKGIFSVNIEGVSSIYTQDKYLDRFMTLCSAIEEGRIPSKIGESNVENEVKKSILELQQSQLENLVKFLAIILDKLIDLMVRPPVFSGQVMNVGQTSFEAMALIVRAIGNDASLDLLCDHHGRNSLLTTYVQYQCCVPNLDAVPGVQFSVGGNVGMVAAPASPQPPGVHYMNLSRSHSLTNQDRYHNRSSSNPDMVYADVDGFSRGVDRTSSMRTGLLHDASNYSISHNQRRKLVHEELALQWVVSSGSTRELALTNSWFFFELMVKSMTEYLAASQRFQIERKMRFSEQFVDDVTTLVNSITSDIICRYNREVKDMRFIQSLNTNLAFFLNDLLSIMDRGYIFNLIKMYCKQMSAKIASLPDAAHLTGFKIDFLRVVCSHEHFVTLNLPFGTPVCSTNPASPSPSISSQSSRYSATTLTDSKGNFSELSTEFRRQHFLIGLVLSDLATVFKIHNQSLHGKAVDTVCNLLTCHDWDPRYAEPEYLSRVANLYLPLIGIVVDCLPQLYDWHVERGRPSIGYAEDPAYKHGIDQSVAMMIAESSLYSTDDSSPGNNYDPLKQNSRCNLGAEATRNLLACFLWVLKNVEDGVLVDCWLDLSFNRLHQLLEILYIAVSCFEYKGRKAIKKFHQQSFHKSTDVKSRLEDMILGQGSARNELMMRRKGANSESNPPSPNWYHQDRLRWRKDQIQYRQSNEKSDRPIEEMEHEAHIEGNLATESTMIILDTLELIVKVVNKSDMLQGLLGSVLRVLLHALSCNQSTMVLRNIFATQRSLVFKFPELLFEEETELCADLCLRLLKHCSSSISCVRSQSSASLYLLMRQNFEIGNNFARVKMQVTMSLSSLVGTSRMFNEEYLRRSLKTILTYAEEDLELQDTSFPEQVQDLVFNLHMILSDTIKMKEFQEDPEMLLDLMYRIAKGYQNSPDLRLTWLANMAQKHTERNNHAEAAQCLVHSAALVAEYLHMLEDKPYLPVGCVKFEKLSPNVLEESAVSDDVVSPDEEGICTGKYFTETGLVGLLEQAANSFNLGGMYEAMNDVYKILIPVAESHRDHKKLANIHNKLYDAFVKIGLMEGKRVFGTYFRIGFYGSKFGDLDGEEFIYKEPTLTKLPEISHRLENFYAERFGGDYVEVIKDSNNVDRSKLNPEKAYIQITYVEPYFDSYELRDRITYFDKNYNIKRFVYSTPFTLDGRPHGELHEQYKRKTIVDTVCSFPYVKTRIQVIRRKQFVLTPIEVAIEDIQKRTKELASATEQDPPDPKILQMVLQGGMGATVNQGPTEVALVFLNDLAEGNKTPNKLQNKLRLCFKDFSKKCSDALRRNKTLIGPDQRDYQRELERNFHRFTERLRPMINVPKPSAFFPLIKIDDVDHSKKSSPVV
ncbi:DOCK6 (predicted) [Pycnogonum litorale]